MSTFETACPDCSATFEVDDEYRGQQADCPGCGCLFLIPQTGNVGQKVSAESLFTVTCPKCNTGFEVPNEYRGEQADCTNCGALFLIPDTGNTGVLMSAPEAEAPAAAAAPARQAPAAPSRAPAPAAPPPKPAQERTSSGIQAGTGVDASYKKSGTVWLSRAAILENVMKPVLKDEVAKKGAPGKGPAPAMSAPKPRMPPPPAAPPRPVSRPPTTPPSEAASAEEAAPPRQRKAAKKVTLPAWTPDLRLGKRETVMDYKPCIRTGLGSHYTLTLLPVILIPVAVFVTNALPAILSALAFTLISGIVWAIYAFVMLPSLCRRGLVITSRRAILIEEDRLSDIEIEE